jgi:CRP/FNR family cyclic AMP-dependent transcriptional regulator
VQTLDELIGGGGVDVHFGAGDMLLREGERAERFFVLREGRVALEIAAPGGSPLVIDTLADGDVLGLSWLFEPYRWQFDARALDPVHAVAFDAASLRGRCETDHELGYELMRRFGASMLRRLQATRLQLLDVYGHVGAG